MASIVGSGFLIVAPPLGATVGTLAVVAMIAIVGSSRVGGVIRYQITNVEDIVAVAFYLELLGALVLRLVGVENPTTQKIVASGLVILIGGFGM